MKILFIHQNFPGQFRSLAPFMNKRGHEVAIMMDKKNRGDRKFPAYIKDYSYDSPGGPGQATHHYLKPFEGNVRRGQVVFKRLIEIRNEFIPDIVVGHSGWGELLYVKEALPNCKVLAFSEYFFQPRDADIGFDSEFPSSIDDVLRTTTRNAVNWQTLHAVDWMLMPTAWQASTHPVEFLKKSTVIFDGVDTQNLKPNPSATFTTLEGKEFKYGDEIITFINRNFEPYRGFHVFYRALPEILKQRPNAHVLMIGGGGVSYGNGPKEGGTWREKLEKEVGIHIPQERVHWTGRLEYAQLVSALQISRAHVYLTYPFVQSWSMVEAMGLGALVVGSRTSPVQEFIQSEQTGLLFDFFNQQQLVEKTVAALSNPERYAETRIRARQFIQENYDIKTICLPKQAELIENVAKTGKAPIEWATADTEVIKHAARDTVIRKFAEIGRVDLSSLKQKIDGNQLVKQSLASKVPKSNKPQLMAFTPVPEKADMLVRMCSFVPTFMDVRTTQPMRALAQLGNVRSEIADKVIAFGVPKEALKPDAPKILILQRHIPPPGKAWIEVVTKLYEAGWLIVSEWDDHPDKLPPEIRERFGEHGWMAFSGAHAVQTSTDYLADRLREYNPNIAVFKNNVVSVVPDKLPSLKPQKIFFGALNRKADWLPIIEGVNNVAKNYPNLEWHVVWDKEFYDVLQTRNKNFHTQQGYENYLALLGSCDIALMPLADTNENKCKSDIKFIEAASRGVAVLASPTIYEIEITHGENGLIAETAVEWEQALQLLITKEGLANAIAYQAKKEVKVNRIESIKSEYRLVKYRNWWNQREKLHQIMLQRLKAII
jgi:glycosyltransferase involved in cell wall biosynthesis